MISIRPAAERDWPSIWRMFQHVARSGESFAYDATTSEEVARRLWFETPARAFVAQRDGGVIATYYLRPNQPGRGDHVANAGYIVEPAERGAGIATQLCRHSLEMARQCGYQAMQFNFVVASNPSALRVWQKCGFSVIGRIPAAFRHDTRGLVDALILHCDLRQPQG